MAGAILTYTPSDVKLAICGYVMTGIVKLDVEWNAEAFRMVRGIRGHNTRVQNLDSSAILTLELLPTSSSNDVLSSLLIADKVTQSSRLLVSIQDTSGRTSISSSEAYISKFPAVSFSDELQNRVWVIHMLETEAKVGGNSKRLPDLFNSISDFVEGFVENFSSIDF